MKVCPTCKSEFADETLSFCLMDGTPLVEGSALPTVAIATDDATTAVHRGRSTRPTPTRKKSKIPWIIAAVLGMMILIGVSAYFLAVLMWRGQAVQANRERANSRAAANTSATPKPAQSETPPSSSETEPSPDAGASPSRSGTDADETTPIQWTTAAMTFDATPGRKYRFECPKEGTAGGVWGSDVYSAASSICTAGVHAGAITVEDGGQVEIEFRPGRSIYGSTTRNGVTTYNYGEYPNSFVVLSEAKKE